MEDFWDEGAKNIAAIYKTGAVEETSFAHRATCDGKTLIWRVVLWHLDKVQYFDRIIAKQILSETKSPQTILHLFYSLFCLRINLIF